MKNWERTAIAHASLLGGCVALRLQGVQVRFGLLRDVDWVLALVFGRHVCGFVDLGRWLDLRGCGVVCEFVGVDRMRN